MKITEDGIDINDENVKSVSIEINQIGDVKKQEIFIIMSDQYESIDPKKLHKDAT